MYVKSEKIYKNTHTKPIDFIFDMKRQKLSTTYILTDTSRSCFISNIKSIRLVCVFINLFTFDLRRKYSFHVTPMMTPFFITKPKFDQTW